MTDIMKVSHVQVRKQNSYLFLFIYSYYFYFIFYLSLLDNLEHICCHTGDNILAHSRTKLPRTRSDLGLLVWDNQFRQVRHRHRGVGGDVRVLPQRLRVAEDDIQVVPSLFSWVRPLWPLSDDIACGWLVVSDTLWVSPGNGGVCVVRDGAPCHEDAFFLHDVSTDSSVQEERPLQEEPLGGGIPQQRQLWQLLLFPMGPYPRLPN